MADATPEARRQKALVTDRVAKKTTDAERNSVRQKIDRLKALRLSNEAAAGVTEVDKKSAPKRSKPKKSVRPDQLNSENDG